MDVAVKPKTASGNFDVVPLTKHIGAEIRGIDLAACDRRVTRGRGAADQRTPPVLTIGPL
jgi:hypothetical protein